MRDTNYYDNGGIECYQGWERILVEFGGDLVDCKLEYTKKMPMIEGVYSPDNEYIKEIRILKAIVNGEDLSLTVEEWGELRELCLMELGTQTEIWSLLYSSNMPIFP